MCGRAAQTYRSVSAAAGALGSSRLEEERDKDSRSFAEDDNDKGDSRKDNYNMSPGMEAHVFCWREGSIELTERLWGLLPRASQQQQQGEASVGLHFSSNMFNARSDTLFDKFTFSKLLAKQQTCLIAIDGFFEWKTPTLKGSKKQPYYVYNKTNQSFLLLAGLYDDTSNTFTIVTTDVCPCLSWLHSRMPLILWEFELAKQWLQSPSRPLLKQMEKQAWNSTSDQLSWHAVTTKMSQLSFRGPSAIEPVKQPASVKSFFAPKQQSPAKQVEKDTKTSEKGTADSKKRVSPMKSPTVQIKKQKTVADTKKGSISSFFSPKSK